MLTNYFNFILKSQRINSINIFINLDDVFHSLHKPFVNDNFQTCGINASKQLVSNVFNLIAHYKQWGSRKFENCKVYAIYTSSYGNFKNDIYIPNYRKKYKDYINKLNTKYFYVNEAIKDSYKLMAIISKYIKDIYVIDSHYVEPSTIPLYISNEINPAMWNLYISRDIFDLQYSYRDRWTLMVPRGDNSSIVNKNNLWEYIALKEKVTNQKNYYDPKLYTFALALTGDSYRNIPRLKRVGWKTLFGIFNELEDFYKEEIQNLSYTTIESHIVNILLNGKIDMNDLNNNLNVCDLDFQVKNFGEVDKSAMLPQFADILDLESLNELNKLHFRNYPINLPFLISVKQSPHDKWIKN
jgi:hypothetical protein